MYVNVYIYIVHVVKMFYFRLIFAPIAGLESKTFGSLLGFEDDFTDAVKTSTLQPTGTLYENASTASITNSSSTGSFDLLLDKSSTL